MFELTAAQIAGQVQTGETSAAEVTEKFIARIQAVNPQINAVIATRFDQARQEAAAIDRRRQAGEPLGPLAGVPITVKDCFDVRGLSSALGIAHRRDQLAENDSPLVAALQAAGGIVLGKTNVPQLMFFYETDNPLNGRTNHPARPDRSPGGSSGGEAAIVAAGGSVIGLGTDLGGSIRQPAHSCGVHGFKPTAGRLTNVGCLSTLTGMDAVTLQAGPLARSVDDLALTMRILAAASTQPLTDHRVSPVVWNGDAAVEIEELKIAYWTDDGYFSPSPGIARAVLESAEALRAVGAKVEPFTPPNVPECMAIYTRLLGADGGNRFRRLLGDSPRDFRIKRLLRLGGLRQPLRYLAAQGFSLIGQHRKASLVRMTGPISADAYWQLVARRDQYVRHFMDELRRQKFDAMICPTFGVPAIAHGTSLDLIAAGSYSILGNMLGIPAGTLAATRVRPGEETSGRGTSDPTEIAALKAETGSAGLPIGVQVMAAHWREDIVLAVMKTLENHFLQKDDYPARNRKLTTVPS